MARIALDAMGGDLAPTETVKGAVEASRRGIDVVLVGDRPILEAELADEGASLPIVDAPDVIAMGEDAARAFREKPRASINVAAKLVDSGDADGIVSAGSTGAAMAAAAISIGRLAGLSRPAIATIFPTPGTPTLVLDAGANIDVSPSQLAQFGVMGSVAAQVLLGVPEPRVGLLSIGQEKGKGREIEKAAHDLLDEAPITFIGNVEGTDLAVDKADVIVTDGFTGNVLLKTTEGIARLVAGYVAEELSRLDEGARSEALAAVARVKAMLDHETYGGAHLLGVRSVVIIAHGSSSRAGIANALAMASEAAISDLPGRLESQLRE